MTEKTPIGDGSVVSVQQPQNYLAADFVARVLCAKSLQHRAAPLKVPCF
jgi:hypothetical protein